MNNRIYLAAAIAAVLAGCTGGQPNSCKAFTSCDAVGGGGAGGGLMTISQDNALDTLREAWFGAVNTVDMPTLVLATGVGDTSGGVVFAGKLTSRPMPNLDPFGPTAYNCPTSGTFTVEGDVADQNTVTAGDFAIYTSSACDSGTGYTVDGTHRIDIDSIVGDPNSGQYEHGQTFTFTDFVAAGQSETTTVIGDHSSVIDTTSSVETTMVFSGSVLAVEDTQATITNRNFSGIAIVQNNSPFNFEMDVAGTANSSLIQGSFDYFISETWITPFGENPTDGHFNILGNGGSTARVVVFDQNTVRVQVDANGSSNYELSVDMSWDEFLAGTVPLTAANNTGMPD